MRMTHLLIALTASGLMLTGCADGDSGGGAGAGVDTGGPRDFPESACRVPLNHLRIGLTAETPSGITVRVDDADFIPARKFENAWTVTLVDDAGSATGATLSDVQGFMPDHGHGSTIPSIITDMGNGQYQVEDINLWMDGHWEVNFLVTTAQGATEEAQFEVCVPK